MNYSFETGPIRPPSEAHSLLLRVTRNCPWNKCAFCNVYKSYKYSRRTVEEIKNDIDIIKKISLEILDISVSLGYNGAIDRNVLLKTTAKNIAGEEDIFRVGAWLLNGAKTVFLQDANSLIIKTSELVEILNYLKENFPAIERITTYARSQTVCKKTVQELKELKNAGLTRIHIGMESGSDRVLNLMQKGVTAWEHVSAGQKTIEAGFDLSEYYMPGLGGKGLSRDHALESARVLNEINPTFIRIRSAIPIPGTPLFELMNEQKWIPLTEEEKIVELRLFIETLDGISSSFVSDHMMNLLEDLGGKLPEEKGRMIQTIEKFQDMEKEDKERFILGRRLGYYRYLSDYRNDAKIEEVRQQVLANYSSIDEAITQIIKNFM